MAGPVQIPSAPVRRKDRGFSLVAVLMLMLLLSLIALGMLSLASVELRQSGAGTARSIARANARLAMQLAIASLQRSLGPDGRVSATAELFDTDPSTPDTQGVTQPHWTGAWTASKPGTAADMETPWKRDDADGGLRDARATGEWPRTTTLDWMVSYPPGSTTPDPRTASRDANWVRVVSTGDEKQDVWVPSIPVSATSNGRFGWWVGDEGVKAKVNVPDAWAAKEPDPANAANGGYFRRLVSQTSEPGAVDEALEIEEADKAKVVTAATHKPASTATREAVAAKFHDFTASSLGLPVDVRHARLKRDLTAYIAATGAIADLIVDGKVVSPGLADSDALVGPANAAAATREGLTWNDTRHRISAPRFNLLKRWARFASDYPVLADAKPSIPPRGETTPLLSNDDSYDRTNLRPAAVGELDTPSVSPVLVEGSIYYNLSTESASATEWSLTVHLYPRVVIWNPYNLELEVPATTMMLMTNGDKVAEIQLADGSKVTKALNWAPPVSGPIQGTLCFGMAPVKLKPGACAVFSPVQRSAYTSANPSANSTSATAPPSSSRAFTVPLSGNLAGQPVGFREAPVAGSTQAQDYRMLWKNGSASSFSAMQSLPQIAFVSCALQYGDERELPVEWNSSSPAPIPSGSAPMPDPDVRTRDGFRLRWFRETPSNFAGSGALRNTAHFDISPVGNWNPRAAYSFRSPHENVTDLAPAFFGAYTRDLFDGAVSWADMMPSPKDGLQQTWPFGPSFESPGPVVLFDVPRKETGVISLAQFQHAKLSEFVWHPSYAVGNSLADPRLETRTDRTAPVFRNTAESAMNGWNHTTIGWATGRTAGYGNDTWAYYARWLIGNLPATDAVTHDLSFDVNHTLWDDFFLSTGTSAQKQSFATSGTPLPNGRMRVIRPDADPAKLQTDLADFHRAASRLAIDGAFNVNSTRVDAWKTVLAGTRGVGTAPDKTIFPRLLNAPEGEWQKSGDPRNKTAWSGSRVLDDTEIDTLAKAIVVEVKKRGPFLSLSDFVNRRLTTGETGKAGPLEAAIQAAGLNKPFDDTFKLTRDALNDYADGPNHIADITRINPQLMPPSKAWGAASYLTQADVLQPLGPLLTPRSDTFVIRAYGDCRSSTGTIEARAWCEVIVQRLPEPMTPDGSGLNPLNPGSATDLGRRFTVTSFRWLNPSEV